MIRRPQSRLSSAISLRKLTTDRLVIAMHSSHELLSRERLEIADPAYFVRVFRLGMGFSPTEYRRKINQEEGRAS